LPQPPGLDRGAAGATGFAGAAVDVERQLKIPRFAAAVAEVAQGGAAPGFGKGWGRYLVVLTA